MAKNNVIKITDAGIRSNEKFYVRVSDVVTDKKAVFEVPPTHNALVIKGGNSRLYKEGVHPVFEDKQEIKDWKHGVSVDVIYIQKDTAVQVKWGTRERFPYLDPLTKRYINIGARGACAIRVVNLEKFYRQVVGVKTEYTVDDFSDRFSVEIVNEFTDNFLSVVNTLDLTFHQFTQLSKPIAAKMEEVINPKLIEKWGIEVLDFQIENINISEDDREKLENYVDLRADEREELRVEQRQRQLRKEELSELERLDDKQWEREKYLRNLGQQDRDAYYDVLKTIGTKSNTSSGSSEPRNVVYCPKCGNACKNSDEFCQKCGNRLHLVQRTCSKCGRVNPGDAGFCSGCGNRL